MASAYRPASMSAPGSLGQRQALLSLWFWIRPRVCRLSLWLLIRPRAWQLSASTSV